MNKEYERVREEIAKWLHSHTVKIRRESKSWIGQTKWEELTKEYRIDIQEGWRKRADEILSIKGIAILSDDQSVPEYENYYPTTTFTPRYQFARHSSWSKGQLQMLKAGFVKVVKEEE